MKRKPKIFEFRLPNYLGSYLINGDASGLEDSEIAMINKFLKKHKLDFCEMRDDSSFYHSNDLNNLGGNCSTFVALKFPRGRILDRIITKMDCKFGAPMGRASYDERDPQTLSKSTMNDKIFDCAVPMSSDSAYDLGGAYWGIGKQLRVKYNKTLTYIQFYRKGEDD